MRWILKSEGGFIVRFTDKPFFSILRVSSKFIDTFSFVQKSYLITKIVSESNLYRSSAAVYMAVNL